MPHWFIGHKWNCVCPACGKTHVLRHSKESKQRRSVYMLGNKRGLGHVNSDKQLAAVRLALIGRKHSLERINKQRHSILDSEYILSLIKQTTIRHAVNMFTPCPNCGAPGNIGKRRGKIFCSNKCKNQYTFKTLGMSRLLTPNARAKWKQRTSDPTYLHKLSVAGKRLWLDSEYAHRTKKAQGARPNNDERKLTILLSTWFPNEWKYVGDGQFWVEGKNPDWVNINGKKLLIEYNGFYTHTTEKDEAKAQHYTQYGFRTLNLYPKDLHDLAALRQKIKQFMAVSRLESCGSEDGVG